MRLSRAAKRGRQMRRKLGLRGAVDVDSLAEQLGLRVIPWKIPVTHEMKIGEFIAVKQDLPLLQHRWAIAHAIGHQMLHPGNHLWLRVKTRLGAADERQAEDFAFGLLVDEEEAEKRGTYSPWGMASLFGVPLEMVEQRWE